MYKLNPSPAVHHFIYDSSPNPLCRTEICDYSTAEGNTILNESVLGQKAEVKESRRISGMNTNNKKFSEMCNGALSSLQDEGTKK